MCNSCVLFTTAGALTASVLLAVMLEFPPLVVGADLDTWIPPAWPPSENSLWTSFFFD